jgi:hypothetical protein
MYARASRRIFFNGHFCLYLLARCVQVGTRKALGRFFFFLYHLSPLSLAVAIPLCVPADDDIGADASTRVRQMSYIHVLPATHKETLRLCTETHTNVFIPFPSMHCKSNKNRNILFCVFNFFFKSNFARRSLIILTCQNSVCWTFRGGLFVSSIVYPRLLDEPMHKIEISTSCAEHLLPSCSISHSWLTSLYAPD